MPSEKTGSSEKREVFTHFAGNAVNDLCKEIPKADYIRARVDSLLCQPLKFKDNTAKYHNAHSKANLNKIASTSILEGLIPEIVVTLPTDDEEESEIRSDGELVIDLKDDDAVFEASKDNTAGPSKQEGPSTSTPRSPSTRRTPASRSSNFICSVKRVRPLFARGHHPGGLAAAVAVRHVRQGHQKGPLQSRDRRGTGRSSSSTLKISGTSVSPCGGRNF